MNHTRIQNVDLVHIHGKQVCRHKHEVYDDNMAWGNTVSCNVQVKHWDGLVVEVAVVFLEGQLEAIISSYAYNIQ